MQYLVQTQHQLSVFVEFLVGVTPARSDYMFFVCMFRLCGQPFRHTSTTCRCQTQ